MPALHVLASVLAWMSAVINPFIYAGSSRYYRAICRQLVFGDRSATSACDGGALSDDGADGPALQWEEAEERMKRDAV